MDNYNIFFCCVQNDIDKIENLCLKLNHAGIRNTRAYILSDTDLGLGICSQIMKQHIECCDLFVMMLSKHTFNSLNSVRSVEMIAKYAEHKLLFLCVDELFSREKLSMSQKPFACLILDHSVYSEEEFIHKVTVDIPICISHNKGDDDLQKKRFRLLSLPAPESIERPDRRSAAGLNQKTAFTRLGGLSGMHKNEVTRKKTDSEPPFSTVYAPSEVESGSEMIVQVFLYAAGQEKAVKEYAGMVDPSARQRNIRSLECPVEIGQRVDVRLQMPGQLQVEQNAEHIVWRGSQTSCEFVVGIPEGFSQKSFVGTVVLCVEGLPVGKMSFNTEVKRQIGVIEPSEVMAHPFNKIFISYSSKDYDRIRFFAEGCKIARQNSDYFFDRHSLAPGMVYPEKIFDYISECDLFVLCWSQNAAQSDWVLREKNFALEVHKRPDSKLNLYPMSILPEAALPEDMVDTYSFGRLY